ncbi:Acetyltransferase (GNAT) family protein [Pseudoruegeria aquimaris]|uniref:Acetyltransferase (GNAT) family protein n=1 Tax=Pseudoruegeria aquimaris TaxID=393663 RepID=A0A1Y5S0U3_9RHOB|nr:GNAT family N-acetyltransferase [Pseudoruegeria aquimaris]SLN29914.1 Acetyltransferase (GNAT) family protein [Pseudoruegeria aquimaris]
MTFSPIRTATPRDLPEIEHVFAEAYSEYESSIKGLPNMLEGLAEAVAAHEVWVIEKGRKLVGCLILKETGNALHVVNVATLPEVRGQGLGGAMMRFAEAEGALRDVDRMRLATHVDMPGNVAMYRHLGWTETGRDGARVYMEKVL